MTCRDEDVYLISVKQLEVFAKALQGDVGEPVGYIDEFGNFENSFKSWMKDEPNVEWTPLFTSPPNTQARLDKAEARIKELEDVLQSFSFTVSDNFYKDVSITFNSPHKAVFRLPVDSSKSFIFQDLEDRRQQALTDKG